MPSADLDQAVATAVKARVINNGQSCIAAKRFIVHESIAGKFLPAFVNQMEALQIGDPLDPSTQIGPLATPQILEGVAKQVDESVRAGAKLLTGGRRLERPGNFYPPTVLSEIPREAPAYSEEVFGPVALVFSVKSPEEALDLANESRFGLGSCLWTRNEREQELFIERIEAGLAFVNGMVASDPRLPFGGVKHSGYGRELGEVGIHEFVNIKTVWIAGESGAPAHLGATE
jgi:succinate-semialdehyde dehydrogenase/glutarate-semialdehyde dehydrogenase